MRRILAVSAVAVVSGLLGAPFFQPSSAIRQSSSQAPILVGAHADSHVSSIIERSCLNCHSLQTEWPAYSRVYPFSRMIEQDVATARIHMNLSRWETYSDDQKGRMLAEIGSVVRNHIMPPRRYTIIHPQAQLSDSEANEIYRWTRTERRLLNHSSGD